MIAAIIQARMGSTRLPGKVLMDIVGKPLLGHVIGRVRQATCIDTIVVATTVREDDNTIIDIATKFNAQSFAGSENDVLDRYYQAATKFGAQVVVRITADCPFIDPRVLDKIVQRYLKGDCDYASNTFKRTYPDGLDAEVFSFAALEKAWREAKWVSEREHVTPYIWKNPGKFRLAAVENNTDLSQLRWTVDEKTDLEFVRQIYKYLYQEGETFYMEDILELLQKHPELNAINQGIGLNEGYIKSLREDKKVN